MFRARNAACSRVIAGWVLPTPLDYRVLVPRNSRMRHPTMQTTRTSALVGEVMRPNPGHPYHLAITFEEDRHRDEERRHERHRALLESRAESPSLWARLEAAALILVRSEHR